MAEDSVGGESRPSGANPETGQGEKQKTAPGGEAHEGSLELDFLARMGHELRTPLNAIIGFVRLVEEEQYSSEEERRDYLANARTSAHSLLELINNILDLAAIEAGKLELKSIPVNLSELVEEVTRTLAPGAHSKGVEIDCLAHWALRRDLLGDPVRLRQVLFNLAGNAVKFSPSGLVLIRAEMLESGAKSCRVRLSVEDHGIGIAKEWHEAIFDSFVQNPGPAPGQFPGVGLGLAISKQIVEQMQGSIGLTSELREGSTFWVELTLDTGGSSTSQPASEGPPPLEGIDLLLLNPNSELNRVYGEKLAMLGAEVQLAPTPQEALALLAAQWRGGQPFQVVMIDHRIEPEDAIQFARSVRGETGRYQPDLVYLSPTGIVPESQRMIESGITAFLTKPLTFWQLEDALQGLLSRHEENGAPPTVLRAVTQRDSGSLAFDPGQVRLLVAEDNLVNQKLIHALLSKQGIKVQMAQNGREAVEMVRRQDFDLVLMDVQMPEMDGLTATREIRRIKDGQALPIIALTAESLTVDVERCIAAGMNDHLAKPIMPDLLKQKLSKWLDPAKKGKRRSGDWRQFAPYEQFPSMDLDQMSAIHDYAAQHNPGSFENWVRSYLDELPRQLEALSQAREERDWELVHHTAQALRMGAAGFGAPRLNAMAREMGNHARNRSAMLVNELFPFLRRESLFLAEELKRRVAEPGPSKG
ncbi:MAG: response regulator [SAR324 cluster bacterium]|nr:response regulator [SAR324 cluster bacterium]